MLFPIVAFAFTKIAIIAVAHQNQNDQNPNEDIVIPFSALNLNQNPAPADGDGSEPQIQKTDAVSLPEPNQGGYGYGSQEPVPMPNPARDHQNGYGSSEPAETTTKAPSITVEREEQFPECAGAPTVFDRRWCEQAVTEKRMHQKQKQIAIQQQEQPQDICAPSAVVPTDFLGKFFKDGEAIKARQRATVNNNKNCTENGAQQDQADKMKTARNLRMQKLMKIRNMVVNAPNVDTLSNRSTTQAPEKWQFLLVTYENVTNDEAKNELCHRHNSQYVPMTKEEGSKLEDRCPNCAQQPRLFIVSVFREK